MDSMDTYPYHVVIAHGPGCKDGVMAAYAWWKRLPEEYRNNLAKENGFYTDAKNEYVYEEGYCSPTSPEGAIKLQQKRYEVVFVFLQPNQEVPIELIKDKYVLILDLDMGDPLVSVVQNAKSVMLVDHHDSTPLTIAKHSKILLDECRGKFATFVNTSNHESGASLSWKLAFGPDLPELVRIVRMSDTWNYDDLSIEHPKEISVALTVRNAFRSFFEIDNVINTWEERKEIYIIEGRVLIKNEKNIIKQIAKQCDLGYIETEDGKVYTIAYTQSNVFVSEVGAKMKYYAQIRFKTEIDFCATWKYVSNKNLVIVSLRSPNDGMELSSIAKTVKGAGGKGGGHLGAAAFNFEGLENFHKFILRKKPESISVLSPLSSLFIPKTFTLEQLSMDSSSKEED